MTLTDIFRLCATLLFLGIVVNIFFFLEFDTVSLCLDIFIFFSDNREGERIEFFFSFLSLGQTLRFDFFNERLSSFYLKLNKLNFFFNNEL